MVSTSTQRLRGTNSSAAIKVACIAATTGNITLSAEQTIDGIALVEDDRCLVKDQTDTTENGIYRVATGAWVRDPDFNGSFDVVEGTIIPVSRGTVNADTEFRITNTGSITVGTTALTFESRGASDASSQTYAPSGTGAVATTTDTKLNQYVSVMDFGATGDGTTDDTTALQAARDYIDGEAQKPILYFPKGVYIVDTSPNWGIQDAIYEFDDVILRHKAAATGWVFDLDGGSTGTNIYNVTIKGMPKLDCVATSSGPIRVRAIHHSDLSWQVLGSPDDCGIVLFSVASNFRVIASVNEQAFTTTPAQGLELDIRDAGEFVADCNFDLIIEGVTGTGVRILSARSCRFKGTSEGNNKGVQDVAGCFDNSFEDLWCEANTTGDWELYGTGNTLINCRAMSASSNDNVELVTADNTRVLGGYLRSVDCSTSSSESVFIGVRSSDNGALGIKGSGTHRRLGCVESDTDDLITGVVDDRLGGNTVNIGTFTCNGTMTGSSNAVVEGTFQSSGSVTFSTAVTATLLTTALSGTDPGVSGQLWVSTSTGATAGKFIMVSTG